MTIYIEYALIDNLIIDAIIVYLVAKTLHTKFKSFNVILALAQGVTYAIITPFITASTIVTFGVKILYGALMVLSLCRYNSIKKYLLTYLLFLSYTFVLGGMCYALLNVFNIPYNQNGILLNGYALPISLMVLVACVYIIVLIKVINTLIRHKDIVTSTYDVIITINGKKHYLRGFLDTGNTLYDDNSPIIVISFATFCKMFKDFPFDKFALNRVTNKDLNNAHYVRVDSIKDVGTMLVFTADNIKVSCDSITIEKSNIHLGVAKKNFTSFECLLHKGLL